MATTTHAKRLEAGRRVFSRVLVGIDGSEAGLEAARQAALLQDPAGRLTLLASWEIPPVIGIAGSEIPYHFDEDVQRGAAERALAKARDYVAPYTPATRKLVRGAPAARLLEEIDDDGDTLVAVGTSGTGRMLGIVEGSVATTIVHRAPCSVLVARPVGNGFPGRIVVGVDGSVESAAAYAAARYLAERFDAELHAVVAWGGKRVSERLVTIITGGEHTHSPEPAAEAITHAAGGADFVVVGSRGLHGLTSLGSVSERVAHAVSCPALVVREPAWERIATELGRQEHA